MRGKIMFRKNKNKGFTLIEVVVAISIVALLSGFVVVSSFVVPQMKMKQTAQTFKTEFELAKEYAESHGGITQFSIKRTINGAEIATVGVEGDKLVDLDNGDNKKLIDDASLEIRYLRTGAGDPQTLEYDESLTFEFSQTEGSIIGPDLVDYIILDNKSKEYKFFVEHETGTLYYDYELGDDYAIKNDINTMSSEGIKTPTFVKDGKVYEGDILTLSRDPNGKTIQPEINYDSQYVKIGGAYRASDIGTYEITFILKDPYETKWAEKAAGWSATPEEPFEVKRLRWQIQ